MSFALAAGELCGLIGANGSGKTTLLRTVLGEVRPAAGQVVLPGRARSLGYVPQRSFLDPMIPLRAVDLVTLGLDGHRFGLRLPSRERSRRVAASLEAVDAADLAGRRVGDLSGGQQQRVLIAHALVRRPRLLLLDEPLAGLDIRSVAGVVALLRRLAREEGMGVLLSAHDMNPLLPAMDRIVYLANGRAASGRTDEVVRGDVLGALYGCRVDVVRVQGRVLVVAGDDAAAGAASDAGAEAGAA